MDELVERARKRDREAFASLVQLTGDRMYAIATRVMRDAHVAEDALQSAFVTAWKTLASLRDPARFEAWFRRILVHACYAEARRRQQWTANVRALPVDGPAAPDGLLSIVDCRPPESGSPRKEPNQASACPADRLRPAPPDPGRARAPGHPRTDDHAQPGRSAWALVSQLESAATSHRGTGGTLRPSSCICGMWWPTFPLA